MKLVVSALAGRDLELIYHFTAEHWGTAKADQYATSIEEAFDRLVEEAALDASSRDRTSNYRRLRTGSHFIFYRVMPRMVRAERILHERMDVRRHLR